ncbi:helix-turn-helix domain-containing protein [Clostridium saccharobutylicum]|uniref:Helix-turn-helix domain protein n=1 Tax=Clostridium saccharobutylicum DSM 13864 TaxID=1345695 RepID=U5MTT8_CLOSA|nr:helix-turn-helix transcriptional regulator [Clostridium saccharobutylicum]AGX43923.1 helix-turn-helix domain protein [Clostridium saccharobutylicum DSM 13864]AQR91221.1 HTH-type transcriptional regulator SinR [Clostridium saccharobutylicum]AQS01125.1 HTH-type transcriptional regulator SinR [Clostridium saccharobutylicum]AQS15108.1 HTH-type transcriptional regulator SinR [Clostridium saccharobutylicum]MBA2905234.1 transcriptional regulator with XRE-family HTH domain [Clostridium saccharobuty
MSTYGKLFGEVIRELRIQKNMSLDELSNITNVSKSYLYRLEQNQRNNPTIYVINRLSTALELDIKAMEKLLVNEECKEPKEYISNIDGMLLNNTYTFAENVATMEVQLSLRDVIKSLEMYCIKQDLSREDDKALLELVDKLRCEVSKLT